MLALRPTFSESWYRVATLKVRLRPGAQISRQFYRGEPWYVVRDPAGNQYHRLSDAAYRFVGLLDGRRSVAQAWELVGGQLDDAAPTQPEVIQILSQLHAANLIEADITPDADVLLRRYKQMERRRLQGRLMNFLFPRIPLWDPDRFVKRWMPLGRLVFSRTGLAVWIVLIIAALARLGPRWTELQTAASHATDPSNWFYLWLTFVITKLLHEVGHAVACRRFGGEVHEMGIMFLVFIPTPYVDASSAWGFQSPWARATVGAAGMYVELFFAAIMAFIWAGTNETQTINALAYNAMLIASVSTVLFNANPLLRYDGYYMLSDMLEIPNLSQKSREYALGLIKRHVFRLKQQQALPPLKQRAWLLTYYIASGIYRMFIGLLIIVMVSDRVPVLGVLMAIGGLVTWLVVPIFKLFRYLTIEPELHRKRGRAWAFTGGVVAAAVVLAGMIWFPAKVWTQAILEPEQREMIRMDYDGFVQQILTTDEASVKKGQVLLVCSNPELDSQITQTQAKLEANRLHMQLAMTADQTQRQIDEDQVKVLQAHLDELTARRDALTIRAPFDGEFISPMVQHLQGRYLKRGEDIGLVATMHRLEARCPVAQVDAGFFEHFKNRESELKPGEVDDQTSIRLAGDISTIIHPVGPPMAIPGAQPQLPHPSLGFSGGGPVATDPKDEKGVRTAAPEFEVVIKVDNADGHLRAGQRVYIRFSVGRETLWDYGERHVRQLLQERSIGAVWS